MWDGKHLVQVYIGIMLIGIFLIELGVWKRTLLIFKSQKCWKKNEMIKYGNSIQNFMPKSYGRRKNNNLN